jgi:hypothetical protein
MSSVQRNFQYLSMTRLRLAIWRNDLKNEEMQDSKMGIM